MGVYKRRDSSYYWYLCEGYADAHGNPLREATRVKHDAPSAEQRRDNRLLAETIYHDRMHDLARKAHALPGGKPQIRVAAFIAWYSEHELPKHRGQEREREILRTLTQAFGAGWLHDLSRDTVKEWITRRLQSTRVVVAKPRVKGRTLPAPSPRTVNREVDVLKAVLQAAVPTYLAVSPLYGMKRLRTPTPKRRLMTRDEEQRLLKVMDVEDRAFFLTGLDTLARLGDIIDLRASDDHRATLWIADPKAGGGFYVPISKRLRKALDALPKDGRTFLFPKRRIAKTERDRRSSVRQMLERACRDATPKVPYGRVAGGLTFHWSTRRTGLTRMLSAGVDLGTAQKIGRWKNPNVVLEAYHELVDDDARRAVEAVGQRDQNVIRIGTNGVQPAKMRRNLRLIKSRRTP